MAKEALQNWEHDTEKLDETLRNFRISSNAIYPFIRKGKTCFLRLAPIDEKIEKNIIGELEFINFLRENDYPALEPIEAKSGEFCLMLETRWGRYYAEAFKSVSGVAIEDTDMPEKIMFEYGKALGRLHCLSKKFEPSVSKWTYAEVLEWIEGVLNEYHAPAYMTGELLAIKKELDMLPKDANNFGLVHYDFEPDNVFYDEAKNTCSVIDFDDGMYHWYALDIEQVLDSLKEELSGERFKAAQREFIRGYSEENSFTEEMEQMLPLMRRFVNLYGYARLIRSVSEKFENEPEWLVKLREKLGKAIANKENNVKFPAI